MQAQGPRTNTSSKSSAAGTTNPFARALAEAEKMASQGGDKTPMGSEPNVLSGLDGFPGLNQLGGPQFDQEAMLLEQQEKAKRDRMRRQLHEQINPVETTKLYDARQKQVKDEIDKLRYELKAMANEVAEFHKEVELTLMTEIGSHPGMDGKYYLNFFQQLRALIVLLRQKIKSARTWATQLNSKKKKKQKVTGAGIVIEGSGHEQTKSVFDMMHHERSNAYGG
ncbi:hypothetical protein KC921_01940 [Candidatus Woesebacteria bacterium]|nr:hypothetical protein [Candidatus Woesebacteria bacterium]